MVTPAASKVFAAKCVEASIGTDTVHPCVFVEISPKCAAAGIILISRVYLYTLVVLLSRQHKILFVSHTD